MSTQPAKNYYQEAEKLLVAVDCIIFGFDKQRLKLLLFKRKVSPFAGEWSLIGSFVKAQENVSDAAERVLEESTGLSNVYMDSLGCYGNWERDPGARVISIAHSALIRLNEHKEKLVETHQAHWFDVDDIPELILDHNQMITDALSQLRSKARYRPIGFELLPEKFTLPQLQTLYEVIYQKTFDRGNFRKKLLSMKILEKLDEKDKSSSRKGAFFHRFDKNKYEELVAKGFDFEL